MYSAMTCLGGGAVGLVGSYAARYAGERLNDCSYSPTVRSLLPWVITTAAQGIAISCLDNSLFSVGIKVGFVACSIFFGKCQGEIILKSACGVLDLDANNSNSEQKILLCENDVSSAKYVSLIVNVSTTIGVGVAAVAFNSVSPISALVLGPAIAVIPPYLAAKLQKEPLV